MSISNDQLSAAKRALLEQRLQKARARKPETAAIGRRPADAPAALSFAQQRLWFLQQYEPHSPAYNIPLALRLRGTLDLPALRGAFAGLIARHEILRTTYALDDGTPVPVLHADAVVPIDVVALDTLAPGQCEHDIATTVAAQARQPFDLTHDLPLRVTLLRVAADEHLLLITLHHIAADGWSLGLLFRELAALYGGDPALAPLAIQYADWAYWQRRELEGPALQKQLAFWTKRLAGLPAALDLPTDRPRPAISSQRGGVYTWQLDPALHAALPGFAQRSGVTPFMVLLAVLSLVLGRYAASDDIAVGSPIAGRTRSEAEPLIGCFVNTLVLRTDLSGNPRVRELLTRVRDVTLDAYAHQDLPFEKLVEELRPERNLSTTPFFQVMLNVHNQPQSPPALSGLQVEELAIDSGSAKFDLNLALLDDGAGMSATLSYSADLFERATIERLAGHFETLLAALLADPDRRVDDLPLLTAAEREELIERWNVTDAPLPEARAVHELIEAQAARVPDAIAVSFEGTDLSYAELNGRANRLARWLRAQGVGPDVPVGLYVERSLDLIVAMLAILKAGGAYVPIDPIYPNDRVSFMLQDVRAPVLLTHAHLAAELPPSELVTLRLDADWPEVARHSDANLPIAVAPEHLMYVLFTSGSTGRPKGVAVEHRNFLNYLAGARARLALAPGLSYALVSTFAADLGTTNIYGALCSGGRLHVIAYERATDPEALAAYFRRYPIDVMKLVPSHFESLHGLTNLLDVVPRARLIFAGEASHWDAIGRLRALGPACTIQNHYGPTETTVSMLGYAVPDAPPDYHTGSVPLGRPFPNVRIYVLDRRMRPVPIGVPGELYIGGAGVARGYLGRAALTAETFVPNPFGDHQPPPADGQSAIGDHRSSDRLYRTGDRVRYLPDGNIEFLGRIDHQVKIRGYRVELSEIETLIAQFAGIHETVVIAREDTPGDRRLVGYLVPATPGATIAVGELRDHLRRQLPDYMVPGAWVVLERLPLNPNGKIDRALLPPPDGRRDAEERFTAPRTPLEAEIAAVWSAVLGVDQVGIDDNFFDLGGESFKAIRVVRGLDRSLSVIELFKRPTIRELAAHLAHADGAAQTDLGLLHRLTPSRRVAPTLSLVCIPYGGGSAITFQPLASALPADYALYAVQIPGHDWSRPDEQLTPLVEVARACVDGILSGIDGPVALYGHCLGGALATEIARQLQAAGRSVEGVILGGTFPAARLPGAFFALLYRLFPTDRWVSNRDYHEFLRAMGGFTDVIDPAEQAFLIRSLRHDAREAEEYYTRAFGDPGGSRLSAPMLCIVGQRDRATELYEERFREWSFFSERVDLAVIARAGHYFLKHQADVLAATIVRQVQVWRGVAQADQQAPSQADQPTGANVQPMRRPVVQRAPSLATFFIVALGQFISMIGTGLSSFALGVWVYGQTGRVSDFALISVMALLPGILAAPLAGAVADRWNRRLVMLLSDAGATLGTVALAALLWSGGLEIWHVYVVTGIGALANAFQRPAYLAAIAQLVPKRYLGQANGIAQLGSAAGDLLAPLLGGALVLLVGLHGIVAIDALTFLIGVTTLLAVRFPDMLFRKRDEPLLREVVSGWRYIIRRPSLVAMVVFFVVFNYLFSLPTVLVTPLVLAFASPAVLGSVLSASGVGALVGALVMSFWGGTRRRADGMIGFTLLFGLSTLVMGLAPTPAVVGLGLFGLWVALVLINAHWMALIQSKVGLELQGRVLATNQMLASSMMPLGFLTAGPLADRVFEPLMARGDGLAGMLGAVIGNGSGRGMALLLVLTGLLLVAWGLLGLSYRPLRYMEDLLPDAIPDAEIHDRDELQALADQQWLARTT